MFHVFRNVRPFPEVGPTWQRSLGAVMLAAFFLVVGCDSGKSGTGLGSDPSAGTRTNKSGAKPTANKGQRQFLTIGTAPAGGAFAPVGNAIVNTLNGNPGNQSWSVSAQGTKGTQENVRKLESGEIEFGIANAAITYFASRGEGNWKAPVNVRVVATIAPNVGIFVTTESSGISSIADLKGKRVVLGPSGAGFEYFLEPLLLAHGVTYDAMDVIHGNYLAAAEKITDGKADAAFMGGAIPIPAVTSLCASQDVVFLPFDEDAAETLATEYPFYYPVPVPAGKYSDLHRTLTGINVGNMLFVSHAQVPDEIVYQVTKSLCENRDAVAEQHPAGKALNDANIVRQTGTPFHPGAIRYYREIGIWPADATGMPSSITEEGN